MSTGDQPPRGAADPAGTLRDQHADLERLRELLLGSERRSLAELRDRLDQLELSPEEIADLLPEAIVLRASSDDQLARALAPTFEKSFDESVARSPERLAEAVYPVIGPAVRRAISEAFAGLVKSMNQAMEHSFSVRGLRWRLEAWRTGVPFPQIVLKHALVYRVEELFLIHGETGLLLAHASHDPEQAHDADLVSSMLTAIRDFVQDSFTSGGDGALHSFSVGELTVLVEAGPRAMLAAAVRGEPPAELAERLRGILEAIHYRFPAPLRQFDGDPEPFEATKPLLVSGLETVLDSGSSSPPMPSTRWLWPVVAVLVLLLLAAGIWRWRAIQRFDRSLAALQSEPGIVVIDSARSWRSWQFRGLRDPLARPTSEVLLEQGGSPGRVEASFVPYISMEPELALRRAGQVLSPPDGVTLSLDDGLLTATGTATEPWLERARSTASLIPGISRFEDSGIDSSVPVELTRAEASIERRQVLYPVGGRSLNAAAQAVVRATATDLKALRAAADALGYRVELAILGRADELGSEEFNRRLSEDRARTVLEALVRAGVSPNLLDARGLGISAPLAADDEDTFSTINRSASFDLVLLRE